MAESQLRINQSIGQIGMKWKRGYFKLENNSSKLELDYGNNKPFKVVGDLKIDNPPAKLDIDQTRCLEELNFRKFNSFTKHLKQEADKKIAEGISEIVQEGEVLAKIENKGKPILQLARKELTEDKKEVTIQPKSAPNINIKTNPIQVKVNKSQVKAKNNFSFPKVEAKGDEVEIYLAQKGKLEIEVDYKA